MGPITGHSGVKPARSQWCDKGKFSFQCIDDVKVISSCQRVCCFQSSINLSFQHWHSESVLFPPCRSPIPLQPQPIGRCFINKGEKCKLECDKWFLEWIPLVFVAVVSWIKENPRHIRFRLVGHLSRAVAYSPASRILTLRIKLPKLPPPPSKVSKIFRIICSLLLPAKNIMKKRLCHIPACRQQQEYSWGRAGPAKLLQRTTVGIVDGSEVVPNWWPFIVSFLYAFSWHLHSLRSEVDLATLRMWLISHRWRWGTTGTCFALDLWSAWKSKYKHY